MKKNIAEDIKWIITELDDLAILLGAHGFENLASTLSKTQKTLQVINDSRGLKVSVRQHGLMKASL
jgi:hypothetical protein